MSEDQQKGAKASDPLEPFRAMRDAYLDAMAKTMVEAVNTEAYAQASGAMLEGCLTTAAPFREAMEKSISQTLEHLSLPSRQEVAVLAERFTHVEMRLDDMDAKLDRIVKMLGREGRIPEPSEANAAKPAVGAKTVKPAAGLAGATAKRTAVRRRMVRPKPAGRTRK
jgi:Poly(R)-hydroxyalkanoic acid synthase subunit (PHA_synth_III_E)